MNQQVMDAYLEKLLPREVWEILLSHITNEEDVLNCRMASLYLANILDSMPPNQTWTPYFSYQLKPLTEPIIIFRKTNGTKFRFGDDIQKFHKDIDQRPKGLENANPFINHTLIVEFQSRQDLQKLQEELLEFVGKYGKHVWRLLYAFHKLVPDCVRNLRGLLQNMENLKSIVFYSSSVEFANAEFEFRSFPDLIHLTELGILGPSSIDYSQPWASFRQHLLPILNKYGSQIRNLHCGSYGDDVFTRTSDSQLCHIMFQKCPNMKKLKIGDFRILYLSPGFDRLRLPLQQIALRLLAPEVVCANYAYVFERILDFLRVFSTTLETLCLHIDTTPVEKPSTALSQTEKTQLSSKVQFPALLELSIPLLEVNRSPFEILSRSSPNLKKLILLDTRNVFYTSNISSNDDLKLKCQHFWDTVVGTKIDTICVRTRTYNAESGKHLINMFQLPKRNGGAEVANVVNAVTGTDFKALKS